MIEGVWDPSGWEVGQIMVKIDKNLAKIPKLCFDWLLTRINSYIPQNRSESIYSSLWFNYLWSSVAIRDAKGLFELPKVIFWRFPPIFSQFYHNSSNFSHRNIPNTLNWSKSIFLGLLSKINITHKKYVWHSPGVDAQEQQGQFPSALIGWLL